MLNSSKRGIYRKDKTISSLKDVFCLAFSLLDFHDFTKKRYKFIIARKHEYKEADRINSVKVVSDVSAYAGNPA